LPQGWLSQGGSVKVGVAGISMVRLSTAVAAIALALAPAGAVAQSVNTPAPPPARQSPAQALAQDAGEYAARHLVPLDEAMRRLRAQEESVAATDRIARLYRDRLAGIAIEHSPDYRIVVLLAGDEPVPEQRILAGGMTVPVEFRTGARATRDQIVAALLERQPAIRAALPDALGMGLDPRTGELVVLLRDRMLDDEQALLEAELGTIAGVPVRSARLAAKTRISASRADRGWSAPIRPTAAATPAPPASSSPTARAPGSLPAAHCPDAATYLAPDGSAIPLEFVGQWGVGWQDVQVHVSAGPQGPYFYADRDKAAVRTLTGRRARASTRAGDSVCHRGESTGYSCSEVELTDFSPPGDLCAGPCTPSWVTVKGPPAATATAADRCSTAPSRSASPRAAATSMAAALSTTTCRPTISRKDGRC
jgi:hypothetical protein